jgi:hypothetical protein
MSRTDELLSAEDRGWQQLKDLVHRLRPADLEVAGDGADGWTAKDLMWHVARWSAEAVETLEQIWAGTYDGGHDSWDTTEERNARWLEESRGLDLVTVKAAWYATRTIMVETFGSMREPTADAIEWFEETGPRHYDDHVRDLRSWVDRLAEMPGPAEARP